METTEKGYEWIPYFELTDEQKSYVKSDELPKRYIAANRRWGLDKLINDASPVIRKIVAQQGYGLDDLVMDEDEDVRRIAAESGHGPAALTEKDRAYIEDALCANLIDAIEKTMREVGRERPDIIGAAFVNGFAMEDVGYETGLLPQIRDAALDYMAEAGFIFMKRDLVATGTQIDLHEIEPHIPLGKYMAVFSMSGEPPAAAISNGETSAALGIEAPAALERECRGRVMRIGEDVEASGELRAEATIGFATDEAAFHELVYKTIEEMAAGESPLMNAALTDDDKALLELNGHLDQASFMELPKSGEIGWAMVTLDPIGRYGGYATVLYDYNNPRSEEDNWAAIASHVSSMYPDAPWVKNGLDNPWSKILSDHQSAYLAKGSTPIKAADYSWSCPEDIIPHHAAAVEKCMSRYAVPQRADTPQVQQQMKTRSQTKGL